MNQKYFDFSLIKVLKLYCQVNVFKKAEQKELVDLFVNKAGLALNDGTMFGKEGAGFMRLNVGCPKSILVAALEKLANAINNL